VQQVKQQFGGSWTEDKLKRVRKYLAAYMQIMKGRPFRVAYIDAFAGTGYVERKKAAEGLDFSEFDEPESQAFLDGSARQALSVRPRFHKYIFIEKSRRRFQVLGRLKEEFPELAGDIVLENGDANAYLLNLCKRADWRSRRAVLFLDPFGMGVDWQTVEAIAATQGIDLWYLFPLGVAVARLLRRDGVIPQPWRERLDRMFGATDWYDAFYCRRTEASLFGEEEVTDKVATFKAIGDYFVQRLHTVFAGVAERPLPLFNSRNNPLFLLCFAAGNPKAAPTAVKIAQHILKGP
jgi:three-Cys-motif partner protein